MKKYVIAVVATIATLFLLAQTGLLAPFGIKQLSFTREKKTVSRRAALSLSVENLALLGLHFCCF